MPGRRLRSGRVPRVVGLAVAKDMMMTARRIGVEEARELGIVHSVYTPEALPEEARRLARRFLAGPPQALGQTKRMLNGSFETSYAVFVELEANAQAVATTTAYHAQALQRFARGQPLRFDWDRAE
ncbi:Enoyl-CoA hydratase [Cupriavidus necator]